MRYRWFMIVCVLGLAGLGASANAAPPNVVFLISDDLTAEALGCYGNAQCNTPNIDRLAKRGMRFTRAFCQFPLCGPSRAALMSGLYAQTIGTRGNYHGDLFDRNLGDRPSMTQHFKQHGYYTARISKIYHMRVPGDITAGVNGPDHAASWTERFNCPGPEQWTRGQHEHLTREKLKPDPDRKIHYNLGYGGAFYVVKASPDATRQPDAQAADKAVELIAKHRGKPFFLAVGMVRPHVPLVAPEEYFQAYPHQKIKLPRQIDNDWDDIPKVGMVKNSPRIGLDTQAKKQKVMAAYYAAVSFMDAQVGRVLDALDEQGLTDNTIIVFTSDHGYHLDEHEFWQKMSLHEESTRIPLIVAGPGVGVGQREALVEQIDIYPTLADLAGLSVPDHCQGHSLKPVLADASATVREAAYSLRRNDHLLRTDRWAYIQYKDGSVEMYDMHNDPHQFHNLAESPKWQSVRRDLAAQLTARLKQINQ